MTHCNYHFMLLSCLPLQVLDFFYNAFLDTQCIILIIIDIDNNDVSIPLLKLLLLLLRDLWMSDTELFLKPKTSSLWNSTTSHTVQEMHFLAQTLQSWNRQWTQVQMTQSSKIYCLSLHFKLNIWGFRLFGSENKTFEEEFELWLMTWWD